MPVSNNKCGDLWSGGCTITNMRSLSLAWAPMMGPFYLIWNSGMSLKWWYLLDLIFVKKKKKKIREHLSHHSSVISSLMGLFLNFSPSPSDVGRTARPSSQHHMNDCIFIIRVKNINNYYLWCMDSMVSWFQKNHQYIYIYFF